MTNLDISAWGKLVLWIYFSYSWLPFLSLAFPIKRKPGNTLQCIPVKYPWPSKDTQCSNAVLTKLIGGDCMIFFYIWNLCEAHSLFATCIYLIHVRGYLVVFCWKSMTWTLLCSGFSFETQSYEGNIYQIIVNVKFCHLVNVKNITIWIDSMIGIVPIVPQDIRHAYHLFPMNL